MKSVKFTVIFFLSCITNLYASEFIIRQFDCNFEGKTNPQCFERSLNLTKDINKKFNSEEELDDYLKDLEQKCINTRLFETCNVSYQSQIAEDNQDLQEISVIITGVESKSFIIIPYPKYSSTEGFKIKAKLQNDNFIGRINPLEAEAFFSMVKKTYDTQWRPGFGGAFKYNFPFYIGKAEFSWDNNYEISYIINDNLPEWKADMGLSFKLPFENIDIKASFKQRAVRNKDYSIFGDDIYFAELANLSLPVKLEHISNWGDVVYTPFIDFEYIWSTHRISARNDDLARQEFLAGHKISTSRIDWHGNFRYGMNLELQQIAGWNFYNNLFIHGIKGEFQGHLQTKYVGFNLRALGFGYLNKTEKIGERLRGVADDQYFATGGMQDIYACSTPAALVLNLDMPIKLFSTAFTDRTVMRYANFEFQISPFIDFALCSNRATGRTFDFKDGFYTAGLELIVFPKHWNSLQLRASAGFDLSRTLFKKVCDQSWRQQNVSFYEISIGFGLFY